MPCPSRSTTRDASGCITADDIMARITRRSAGPASESIGFRVDEGSADAGAIERRSDAPPFRRIECLPNEPGPGGMPERVNDFDMAGFGI